MTLANRSIRGSISMQILAVAALSFLLPAAAHATGCQFSNTPSCLVITNLDGTAGGGATGLTLTGSEITGIKGFMPAGDHATLAFTTGTIDATGAAAIKNALENGGTFNPGGSITIKGTYANIHAGTIFSGTFSGATQWVYNGYYGGEYNYVLTGPVSGTWYVHGMMDPTAGSIVQIDFTSKTQFTGAPGQLSDTGGVTQLFGLPAGAVVPEPNSLMLMGTGLMGAAFAVRRRFKFGKRVGS